MTDPYRSPNEIEDQAAPTGRSPLAKAVIAFVIFGIFAFFGVAAVFFVTPVGSFGDANRRPIEGFAPVEEMAVERDDAYEADAADDAYEASP